MIRKYITMIVLFFCLASSQLSAETVSEESNNLTAVKTTEVIIIGTIHGRHYKNPNYSPEVLKDIIIRLKPVAILNELPLSQWDPNGKPLYRNHEKNPEGWASNTAAQQLKIKQIPFDRPDREENFKKTNYFQRQDKYLKAIRQWAELREKDDPNDMDLKLFISWYDASYAQGYLDIHGTAENINSEGYDRVVRIKHRLVKEIIPEIVLKYPGYEYLAEEGKFIRDQWIERNKIMTDNIVKIAEDFNGKRIVVLTGSEHRYILKDILKKNESIELKEF